MKGTNWALAAARTPALPDVREKLDSATERLAVLREEAERYTGPLEAGEADEEMVTKVWRLVEGP